MQQEVPQPTPPSDRTTGKPLILLVDDEPDNLQVLGNILNQDAYEIAIATNGNQALAFAEGEQPDLILLDIMMPGLDGFEVCRQLKAAPRTAAIPIIFLTARAEPADIVQGITLGAVDYVTKPFNGAELLARVRTHLELCRARQAVERISQERKELLHVLCHDLANPLNAIVGFLDLADDPQTILEVKGLLRQAAANGLALIAMVRQMRAMEDGKLSLQAVNLSAAVRESAAMLKNLFSAKNIQLDLRLEPGLMVRAEKTSLVNSVLNNLLTNAVKFSNRGGQVRLAARAEHGRLFLAIRDDGIGMPPPLLRDLFDISKTTSRPGTEGETGTGFGMPLVRRFMQVYGGEISVTSSDRAAEHGTEVILIFQSAEGGAHA